mgnify:CR=1 FL=1
MQKIKIQIRLLMADLGLFVRSYGRFLFWHGYQGFSVLETGKKLVAKALYAQRGRFSGPFVHVSMGAVVALGITLAPVLASNVQGQINEVSVSSEELFNVGLENLEMTTEISEKVRDSVIEYKVASGDTVSKISEKFGISKETIVWENKLSSVNAIKPGQALRILPVTGINHKVTRGDTIYSIAKKYKANAQAIVDFPFNDFVDSETFSLAVGQNLVIPDGIRPDPVAPRSTSSYLASQRTPNAGAVSATGNFAWPMGGVITQRFGWYHTGLDIATAFGTPVVAADSGVVTAAGWPDNSGYGVRVVIDHQNGYNTWYAHLTRVAVSAGQTVKRGDVIGYEGSTGRSTGPHLHFEVRRGTKRLNPLEFLK